MLLANAATAAFAQGADAANRIRDAAHAAFVAGVNGGAEHAAGQADEEESVAARVSMALRRVQPAPVLLPDLDLPPITDALPYDTLEVLINHENVWANIQGHAIPPCGFDLDDETRWLPFIKPGVFEPPPPRPFYAVGRIGPKLPPARLSALRSQLLDALRAEYSAWRTTRSLKTRWHAKLEAALEKGLQTHEMAACSSQPTDTHAIDRWRGALLSILPPDHKFSGRAFSFSVGAAQRHTQPNFIYPAQLDSTLTRTPALIVTPAPILELHLQLS